jgi:hypothetical protein
VLSLLSLLEESNKGMLGYERCKRVSRVGRLIIVLLRGDYVFLGCIEGGSNLEEHDQPA